MRDKISLTCFTHISPSPSHRPSPSTTWLTGLRGLASLMVYWHHHQMFAHGPRDGGFLERSYGYRGYYHIATLPGLRLLFSGGHFAVALFFVASGYALATGPIIAIRASKHNDAAWMLSSLLFRRWMRLFFPVICVTLVHIFLWHAFKFDISGLSRQQTYKAELLQWLQQFKGFSSLFDVQPGPSGYSPPFEYNSHLWTIPIEFRGSLLVVFLLLATARFSPKARLLWEVLLMIYCTFIVDGWYGAMFIMGMFLCECHLIIGVVHDKAQLSRQKKTILRLFCQAVLFAGLYLGGVPHVPSPSILRMNPGWYWLSFLCPTTMLDLKWFYLFGAASSVIGVAPYIRRMKLVLESSTFCYLGSISYGMYLVHGPVMWTLGNALYTIAETEEASQKVVLGTYRGLLGLEGRIMWPQLLLLPVSLFLGVIVTKFIEAPSVRLGKWLYGISQSTVFNT